MSARAGVAVTVFEVVDCGPLVESESETGGEILRWSMCAMPH